MLERLFKKKVQKDVALDIPVLLDIDMATVRILWGFSRTLLHIPRPWMQASADEKKWFREYLDRLVLTQRTKSDKVLYAALLAMTESE